MPSKSKKSKKSKGPPEKVYTLLSLDDIKVREQKYTNRLNDLHICRNFIEDAIKQVRQLNSLELLAAKWLDFISCNPLPKPYIPSDVRVFLTKLKYFESKRLESNIDWPLAVDERNILTQSIFRRNLTRSHLENKLKPDFGTEYNASVNDCLHVIRRIEYFLDNQVEVAKCPFNILADIRTLKFNIQEEIAEFFNRYTYRILCSENAYMNSIDAISTEYTYKADNFQMHIWSLKNVPISFVHLDEPRLLANFHEIDILIHIPSTMLLPNLTIRAIRMNFDHISEKAKSFSQQITSHSDNLNAGLQDLHECLTNEWLLQLDMQNLKREEMIEQRLDYEEKLRQYEEEQAKKGKKKVSDKNEKSAKQRKIIKPTKEPPLIEPDVFPDIYEDFLEEEQRQYETFKAHIYNPELLGLLPEEINLRQFTILGGIYQLDYVDKPQHQDFDLQRFNMTWHDNDWNLRVQRDIYIPSTPRYLARRTTRLMSHLNLQRLSKVQKADELGTNYPNPECPWFVLTITLPEYLCLWGQPIACHYETVTQGLDGNNVRESSTKVEIANSTRKASRGLDKEMQTLRPPHLKPYDDKKQNSILTLQQSSTNPEPAQGYPPSLSLSPSQLNLDIPARGPDVNIKDFPLSNLLDKSQISHLTRHCLPRIISSFKFPKELRDEELEAHRNKSKGKAGIILRKQADELDGISDQLLHHIFTYSDKQNNPERLFAIYPPEELILILTHLQDEQRKGHNLQPQSFLELLKLLYSIQTNYRLRTRRIVDLKAFKSKMKFENQRFKQQSQRTERKPLKSSISQQNVEQSKGVISGGIVNTTATKSSGHKENGQALKRVGSRVGFVELSKQEVPCALNTEPSTYSHWTTEHILSSDYNKEKHTMVIQTDRLGYIGFAFKRYEHFPFTRWSLEPSEMDPNNEVVFTLDTQYVRCVLYCTPNGIRGHVTEPSDKFKRNPKMYLIIREPMKDYKEFKKIFKDNYLNIFAEPDASYYIENGYFSEKHLATEIHTYCCMAIHSTQMKFSSSQWNRLAKRRDLILKLVQFKDLPENVVEVRITPEEAFFVEISELCSDDLDVIKLHYTLTWRNIGSYTDLHHLINSMYPAATEMRCKNPKLISCIRDLLSEIRPLSYS